jgi:rhodanese-related sulfurtransferase
MKKILFVLGVLSITISCEAQPTPKTEAKAEKTTVTTAVRVDLDEFKAKMAEKGIQLVDVRTPQEYNQGHYPNAQNIDYLNNSFRTEIQKLDKTKPIAIYCKSGNRSSQAMEVMKQLGFVEIYELRGGYR